MSVNPTSSPILSCFLIPATLCAGRFCLALQAVMDSGAAVGTFNRFSIEKTVSSTGWPSLRHYHTPDHLHHPNPLWQPSGNTLIFNHTPLVLNHPLLRLHNPSVDWLAGKILGLSPHCHANCLCSALSRVVHLAVSSVPVDPSSLTNVPPKYHDL